MEIIGYAWLAAAALVLVIGVVVTVREMIERPSPLDLDPLSDYWTADDE